MDSNNVDKYTAMQTGRPTSVYKKTILGKIFIQALDPFNDAVIEGKIMKGVPNSNDEGCFIALWSTKEDLYFKRANKYHFKVGNLVPVNIDKYIELANLEIEEIISDNLEEEIDRIVNSPFFTLASELNKTDNEVRVYRLLAKAIELGKSDKIISAIKARLAELQSLDVQEETGK